MTAEERRARVKRSQAQEKRGAARRGTRQNSGSGSGWVHKNDARNDTWLEEYKRTDKQSITLKSTDLEDLRSNALRTGRLPVLHFEVGGRHWSAVLEEDFEERIDGRSPPRP